jgi:hypothetical protein
VDDADGAETDPRHRNDHLPHRARDVSRHAFGTALAAVAFAAALMTLSVDIGAAQEPSVRIEGRVLWIAAETMIVAPYADSAAIKVDLSQVHQDEYMGLVADDSVAVTGTVSNERDRVIATSVQRLTS